MSGWKEYQEQLRQQKSQSAQAARYQGLANQASTSAARSQAAQAQRYLAPAKILGADTVGPSSQALQAFARQDALKAASTGGGAPSYLPGAKDRIVTTDPSEIPMPDPYPTVLPSLSAAQLGQLGERRRLIDERLKQAEAESERRRILVEASATRSRQSAERESKRSIEDFMRQAGGRGLARSPMVAGRSVRRSGEDLRLEYGEIDTRLSTEIAALQDLVSQAENERSIGMAQIEQERVNMQADLDRLFPAASMYRS